MSRLDYCKYHLIHHDCNDWKCDHCDGCNIFEAYCEGARRATADVKRREEMNVKEILGAFGSGTYSIRDNEIIDEQSGLCAVYADGEWLYFVKGVYNSVTNYAEIDIDALKKLVNITAMFSMFERKAE